MTDAPSSIRPAAVTASLVQGSVPRPRHAAARHSRRSLLAGASAAALLSAAGIGVLVITGAPWADGSLFDDETGWLD